MPQPEYLPELPPIIDDLEAAASAWHRLFIVRGFSTPPVPSLIAEGNRLARTVTECAKALREYGVYIEGFLP